MQIQELKLLNFRNYERVSVTFDNNLNIIYGKNGSGKTNLVEAIYCLALTRSFKQINDRMLIRNNTNLAKIEGVLNNKFRNSYKVIITPDGKKVKIDDNKITKISDYISKLNVILFNPNDLRMIKDTPSIRRKYLNISISQLNIDYLKELNNYNKLIKLRNSYLKRMYLDGSALKTYLDVVTDKLINVGMKIYEERKKFIDLINSYISDIYFKIAGSGNLKVRYISDFDNKTKEEILKIYQKNLSRDLTFGKTNMGIHHDDMIFYLDDLDLRDYGSEGQQKNTVISWKFSEIEIFKKEKEVTPLLILDDLLSELDIEKIKNIFMFIDNHVQTFITTTEIEKVLSLLEDKSFKKIMVSNGVLKEVI